MLTSLLIVISLLTLSFPLIKHILKEQKKQKVKQQILASYLIEIQEEIDNLPFDTYLQKTWLYEEVIDEVLEIYHQDKKVLKLLDIEETPDIIMIIKDRELWLRDINQLFIEQELESYKAYLDHIESNPLTDMQCLAVLTNEENNLILAGAGSGKTSVIVAKVGYVLNKGYVEAHEVLVLAFNKKAQQELAERISEKLALDIEVKTFHALGKKIVDSSYNQNCSDFSKMISQAIEAINKGDYTSPYKYIFIDEFQDISIERNSLILALKNQQHPCNITVVGDDWQGINSFAGSELSIIQNFESFYGHTATIKLDYTFRFNATLAKVSQEFILKNAQQIHKEIKTIEPENPNTLYLYAYDNKNKMDEYIEAIVAFIAKRVEEQKSIMILSRYGFYKPKNLESLSAKYKQLSFSFETIHGSKGLEADYIILTHLESGKFGFPSEQKAVELDDYPYAEERRLFYVALTRAKEKVFMIGNSKEPSVFIEEILREHEVILF